MLAVAYIKIAQLLLIPFNIKLRVAFANLPSVKITVVPVKNLQAYKAKFADYKLRPRAAYICDYLRASVLCSTLVEMVDVLDVLCSNFKVTKIISNVGHTTPGSKSIIVNLVVEDKCVKPKQYEWSGWWVDNDVQMIAEVYIYFCINFYTGGFFFF